MTMMVQTSTDEAPELLARIEHRRVTGQDRWDEWWEGVYRIVTGPTVEHQRLLVALMKLLEARLTDPTMEVLPGINIGIDKQDARVPDIAILRVDAPRTSRAFMGAADLVVEILSPSERSHEKLPFYARWAITDYIEIDIDRRSVEILRNVDGAWLPAERCVVVDVSVDEVLALLPD
jgi:Uma2 family endonuclease